MEESFQRSTLFGSLVRRGTAYVRLNVTGGVREFRSISYYRLSASSNSLATGNKSKFRICSYITYIVSSPSLRNKEEEKLRPVHNVLEGAKMSWSCNWHCLLHMKFQQCTTAQDSLHQCQSQILGR